MRLTWTSLLTVALLTTACANKPEGAKPLLTPGSRLLYHNTEISVWSICDKGSRVYMSSTGSLEVFPDGCPDGNP